MHSTVHVRQPWLVAVSLQIIQMHEVHVHGVVDYKYNIMALLSVPDQSE